jgi:two-component system chemotaxis response regulator CheB
MIAENATRGSAADRPPEKGIRVMVVDDSAIIRGLISRILSSDPSISVVASVGNGQMAIDSLSRNDVDVIVMDIEMPVMDGLTALPKLLEVDPDVQIVMASTLTLRNAETSLRALELGAADYIPKPTATRDISGGDDFRHALLEKVRTLGARPRRRARPPSPARRVPVREAPPRPAASLYPPGPIKLRSPGLLKPTVLAIGSSTGGPPALFTVLKEIRPSIGMPVLITQHMPPTFTTILAQHIERNCGWPCREAQDGEPVTNDRIYLAPGGYHMLVDQPAGTTVIRLTQDPPENFCRPAVDPMLRSMIKAYSGRILVVILTGMGADGLRGCRDVVQAGGTVFAQDEATSTVWGMPGAVASDGICSAVLPLKEIGPRVMTYLAGKQP